MPYHRGQPHAARAAHEVRTSRGAIAGCIVYTFLLLVRPDAWCPASMLPYVAAPRAALEYLLDLAWTAARDAPPGGEVQRALYFLVTAGIAPWLCMALMKRGRMHDLGLRRPNRYGIRWIALGTFVSLPFLWWMVGRPGAAEAHMKWVGHTGTALIVWTSLVMMLVEHFFFHGVVLALGRPGGRWPESASIATPMGGRASRTLQWFGFAQARERGQGRPFLRWLGLSDGCGFAVLLSGILFAAVHLGKNPRELLLSLPGGIFLAYLAYRSNSLLVPFLLHMIVAVAGMWFAFEMGVR